MTGRKNGHGDQAASLFPFLAVLLCTVGALVLILIMIVGRSQAGVKEAITEREERIAEVRAQVELMRDGFKDDRSAIQLEIEKKRLSLQSLELQTTDLQKELSELGETAELIAKKLTVENESNATDIVATELQKQLQEAAEKLKANLEKPAEGKPVFAIIPYEGNNGTHRRPIYLDCRADGILIQPEGVLIGLKDLRPPYGPGNPLDAALRTIRNYYAPSDGALNTSAYPLLVVRSSGIRTYALARMAMAGWDDQFGYELIQDDMELTFPDGEPALAKQVEQTLVSSRSRQAALVMAMPGKYRQAMAELSDENIDFSESNDPDLADDSGSALNSGLTGSGVGGDLANGPASGYGSGRGGFAFAPDGSRNEIGIPQSTGERLDGSQRGSSGGPMGFATGGTTPGRNISGNKHSASSRSGVMPSDMHEGSGSLHLAGSWNQDATDFSPNALPGAGSFAEGALNGGRYTRGTGAGTSPNGLINGSSQTDFASAGEAGGTMSSEGFDTKSKTNSSGGNGTFRDAMNAARARQQGTPSADGSTGGLSTADSGAGGSQIAISPGSGFGSFGGAGQMNNDVSGDPSSTQSLSPSAQLAKRKPENAESVAKRKGRNWAWSAGPSRETAVVRTIRVACYEDRWLVLPDQIGKEKPKTVMLDRALQTSAEELAQVIADRVDRWGYALDGGYWKPVLQVEVARGGESRFEQLKKLLDGSGLDIVPAPYSAPVPTPQATRSGPVSLPVPARTDSPR